MTIAAMKLEPDGVHVAADSRVSGNCSFEETNRKIGLVGDFAYAISGSALTVRVMETALGLLYEKDWPSQIVPALQIRNQIFKTADEYGFTPEVRPGQPSSYDLEVLISDGHVVLEVDQFTNWTFKNDMTDAAFVGCGLPWAQGAWEVLSGDDALRPAERLDSALRVACEYSLHSAPPIHSFFHTPSAGLRIIE